MSTIKTNTISNVLGTKTVPTDTVVDGSAKAWVNFNGTGVPAIRSAFNVSSITDLGVGNYQANFTTAFADANYSVTAMAQYAATNNITQLAGSGPASVNVQIILATSGAAGSDVGTMCVTLHR